MLDDQVGCVFQKVPSCKLGGNDVYKSGRGGYWWYYNDTRRNTGGQDHSGWCLSKELWANMSAAVEDMIS